PSFPDPEPAGLGRRGPCGEHLEQLLAKWLREASRHRRVLHRRRPARRAHRLTETVVLRQRMADAAAPGDDLAPGHGPGRPVLAAARRMEDPDVRRVAGRNDAGHPGALLLTPGQEPRSDPGARGEVR